MADDKCIFCDQGGQSHDWAEIFGKQMKVKSNLLNSGEAAAEKGVTPRRLRYIIESGELPAVKVGGAWFIKRGDLKRVNGQTNPSQ